MRTPSARGEGNARRAGEKTEFVQQQPSTAAEESETTHEKPGPSNASSTLIEQEPMFKKPYPVCRRGRKMITLHKEGRLMLEDIRTFVNMRPVDEIALNDATPPWEQIELPPKIEVEEARKKWNEFEKKGLNISDEDFRNAMMFVQAAEYLETIHVRTLLHWLTAPLKGRPQPSEDDLQRAHQELSQQTEWQLRRVMDYCYEHLHVRDCVEWFAFIEHLISRKDCESNGDAPRLPKAVRTSGEETRSKEERRGMFDFMARAMLTPAHFSTELYTKPWLGSMEDTEAWVRAGFFPQEDFYAPEERKEHVETLWEVAQSVHRWKLLASCSGFPCMKMLAHEGRSSWTQDWSIGSPFGVLRELARFRVDAIPARFKQREDGSWIGPPQLPLQLLQEQQSKALQPPPQQRLLQQSQRPPLTIRDALKQAVWVEEEDFPVHPKFARPIAPNPVASTSSTPVPASLPGPSSSSSDKKEAVNGNLPASGTTPTPSFAVPKVPAKRAKRSPRKKPAAPSATPIPSATIDTSPLPPSSSFSVIVPPSEPARSGPLPMEFPTTSSSIYTSSPLSMQPEPTLRVIENLQLKFPATLSNVASDLSFPSTSASSSDTILPGPTSSFNAASPIPSVHAPSLTPPSSSSCSPVHASPVKRKNGILHSLSALSYDLSPNTPSPPQPQPESTSQLNGVSLEQQWLQLQQRQILQLLQQNQQSLEAHASPSPSISRLKRRADGQSLELPQKRPMMPHSMEHTPDGVLNLSRHPLQQLQLMTEAAEGTRSASQAYVDSLSQTELLRMQQLLHTQPNSSAPPE